MQLQTRFAGLTLVCFLCCYLSTGSPADGAAARTTSCNDPGSADVCFESSVAYKVVLPAGETAVLRCVIRHLSHQVVTWMKNDGRDIPMTIARTVFIPDSRVTLDNTVPDEWNIVIKSVEAKDSGEYLCQVNGRNGLMARSYSLVVEEPQLPIKSAPSVERGDKRLLSDDQEARSRSRSPSVSISGEATVFEDSRYFSLTCTAKFSSRDAKMSPRAAIEWYHQGIRQSVNASSMDISMSWADSDRAISVLTIYRVQMGHSGEWVCLKRPPELATMETATHSLTVLAKESTAGGSLSAASSNGAEPAAADPDSLRSPNVGSAMSSSSSVGSRNEFAACRLLLVTVATASLAAIAIS